MLVLTDYVPDATAIKEQGTPSGIRRFRPLTWIFETAPAFSHRGEAPLLGLRSGEGEHDSVLGLVSINIDAPSGAP